MPVVVAASQRPEPSSSSLTRDSCCCFVKVVVVAALREPLPLPPVFKLCSTTTTFMGCHSLALCSRENIPWLVPATSTPLEACLSAKTSFPPRPAAFCSQCCPASWE